MARTGGAIVVVLAALVLAGCGGPAGPSDGAGAPSSSPAASPTTPASGPPSVIVVTPEPLPPGVGLSFVQQRIDEGTRRSQVRVVNGTDRPLRVRRVGLDWVGYPPRRHRVDYVVPAQQTVDLRYLLPRARCAPGALAKPMRGVAETRRGTIRRPLAADGVRFLTRLWTTECHERRLDRAVEVTYGDDWIRRGDRLHGSLVLHRRRGDAAVGLAQVQGSVLFELAAPRRTLLPGRTRLRVPLTVRDGGRCDPHSRGQSTQTFLFRVWLTLDGGPQISRLLPPTSAQQARLLGFLDDVCAGRDGS